MKKTTSSLLIPKIRFQLIKCHRWKGASSDLTRVSQRVATALNGWSSEEVWELEDKCTERGESERGEEGLYSRMEGKERSSTVMDGGREGGAIEKCRKKSETPRFVPDVRHNHPMCLRLAWQRHH